jgi:hypothetical protein
MVGIDTIVWFVFGAIIVVGILALLWFGINYAESKFPMPVAWNIVRVVFVLLCIFFAICVLLGLLGHPLVRF